MNITPVNLTDHWKKAVAKNAVTFGTTDPAAAYDTAECGTAALTSGFVFLLVAKEPVDDIADPVPEARKQIAAAELPRTVGAKFQIGDFSIQDDFYICGRGFFPAASAKHIRPPHLLLLL